MESIFFFRGSLYLGGGFNHIFLMFTPTWGRFFNVTTRNIFSIGLKSHQLVIERCVFIYIQFIQMVDTAILVLRLYLLYNSC